MKKALLLGGLMVLKMTITTHAQTLINQNWNVDTLLTPGNPTGFATSETFQGLSSTPITSVSVNLDISGGYNGGLYGYLVLQNAGSTPVTEVLLNQIGTTPSNLFGSQAGGLDVTLSDTGTANGSIHDAADVPTGTWLPDSTSTLDGTFSGMTANGTWTLFLADLDAGTPAPTLVSWGLDVGVTPVPEPTSAWVTGLGGVLLLAGRLIRNRRK